MWEWNIDFKLVKTVGLFFIVETFCKFKYEMINSHLAVGAQTLQTFLDIFKI